MPEQIKKTRTSADDKYKSAVQDAVNVALEARNLAPAIKTALTEDKPLNDTLQEVMVETVKRNPDMRNALVETIADGKAIKKSRLDYRQPGFWIPILLSLLVGIGSIIVAVMK